MKYSNIKDSVIKAATVSAIIVTSSIVTAAIVTTTCVTAGLILSAVFSKQIQAENEAVNSDIDAIIAKEKARKQRMNQSN
jgi:uncharacterized protein (DUF697 family)